jgi:hypothetical protein
VPRTTPRWWPHCWGGEAARGGNFRHHHQLAAVAKWGKGVTCQGQIGSEHIDATDDTSSLEIVPLIAALLCEALVGTVIGWQALLSRCVDKGGGLQEDRGAEHGGSS